MKTELNSIYAITDSEVSLFRKMSRILSKKYNVLFVEETHQQYVEFQSIAVGTKVKRELSDIWIVLFSPKRKETRMTFLQAKYHRRLLDISDTTFYGDYFQYELLSQRLILTNVIGKRHLFPLDILSFSCCSSVASYGIFYIDNAHQIDMAYSSAKYLTTKSAKPLTHKIKTIDLSIPITEINKTITNPCSCQETISCLELDYFTSSLLDLKIGVDILKYPNILRFVLGFVKSLETNQTTQQFVNFVESSINFSEQEFEINEDSPTNFLLINVDEKVNEGHN